jgi:hypothetical protein
MPGISACYADATDIELLKGHTQGISVGAAAAGPNSFTLEANTRHGSSEPGGLAMWIVMYVAMIASLSAMGLAPNLLPVETDKDQLPHDDI